MADLLSKGQNAPLLCDGESVDVLRLSATWSAEQDLDLDVAALLLDQGGRSRSDRDFVFYNQPSSEDGAVRLIGKGQDERRGEDRILVDTAALGPDVARVVVLVSLDGPAQTLAAVDDLALEVLTVDERPVCRFVLPKLEDETAAVLGELYRREDAWRFRAVGQGYASGLAGAATDFGISVDAGPTEDEPDTAVAIGPTALPVCGSDTASPDPRSDQVEALALPVSPAVASRSPARTIRTRKRTSTPAVVRPLTLGDDDSWKAARLFPVVGIGGTTEQERRATSALLSVLMGVKEFGRAITGRLGAPAGLLETYLEVPFELDDRSVIPDGVLRVARGGRVWTALLEVKTGSTLLAKPQVDDYLAVAKARGYDAVITLSNELPASAGEHPVGVDRRKLRKVALHHLSWAEVVHEATMQLSHRGIADASQAWVLSELVWYLQHPRSGASGFEDMGAAWVPVRDAVVAGTLRAADKKAPDVAASWDRLMRQVCLRKTGELGREVSPVGVRAYAADPGARTAAVVKSLVADGAFTASLRFPGTVGPMHIRADLRTAQVETSVDVTGPTEGRPLTRVNWLLRQLSGAPDGVRIDAVGQRAADSRCELLAVARLDPKALLPMEGAPRSYRLTMTTPLGMKRQIGRGGFITSVQVAVDEFYREVMEKLTAWTPPPPRLPAHDAAVDEDQPEATDEPPPAVDR